MRGAAVVVRRLAAATSRGLLLSVVLSAVAVPAVAADLELSLATDYSSGDYGGSDDIDIVYTPFVASLEVNAWTFKVAVPYLYVHGGTATVETPGGPVQVEAGTTDGLGDILVEGSWWMPPLFESAPYVQIGLRVKIPTGDEQKGLGTGETDVTPELLLARVYGRWTPYAGVGFRVLGDSSTATYLDGFTANAGLTYKLGDRIEPGLFAYWREAATAGGDDSAEILPTLRIQIARQWWIDAYATVGLTDASPDVGGGLQLRWRLPGIF